MESLPWFSADLIKHTPCWRGRELPLTTVPNFGMRRFDTLRAFQTAV